MIGKYIDLGNPVSDHPVNRDLVAWWQPLPNNVGGSRLFDLKGRRHGTLTNGGHWTLGVNGLPALKFDGTDSCVVVPDDAGLRLSSNFTLAAAVRINSTAGEYSIFTKGPQEYEFDIVSSGTSIRFNKDASSVMLSATYPANFAWHHVACTLVGTSVAIYVNGAATTGVAGSVPDGTGTRDLVIGADDSSGTVKPLSGDMADMRIYNVALSARLVRDLYTQWRLGHPDTLRRFSRKTYLHSVAGAAPAGNRRRRVIMCGSR